MKLDPESRRLLTVETKAGDSVTGQLCDIQGKPLPSTEPGILVFTDLISGKPMAKIASVLPSNPDPQSVAQRDAIMALNPVHYDGNDGVTRGWYVAAPDYGYHAQQ